MADPKFLHYKQVIPAGFYGLAFEHEIDGAPDKQIVTWGFGGAGYTLDLTDLDAIGDAWFNDVVDPLASSNTAFVRVTASDADGVVLENDRGDVGTLAGPFSPINVAAIVEKRTGVAGRAQRGRIFLPWVPDADVSERGILDLDYRVAVAAAVNAFMVTVNAIDVAAELVLLHSKGWGPPTDPDEPEPADPGNAPDPTPITSVFVKQTIGTQRRRLR